MREKICDNLRNLWIKKEYEMKKLISLTINEKVYELAVNPNQTLADVIRYEIGLTGTKKGCEVGECGTCTVIMDGKSVNSWRQREHN